MANHVCIVISDTSSNSSLTITQLIQLALKNDSTKYEEGIEQLQNYLQRFNAGVESGTVQVTVRDTDPGISTSGSGSLQVTFSKL
jgi:hypothetical protein